MSSVTDPNWSPDAGYDPEEVPYVIITITVKEQETCLVIGQDSCDVDQSDSRDPVDWDEDTMLYTAGVDPSDYDAEKYEITWTIERVDPCADETCRPNTTPS